MDKGRKIILAVGGASGSVYARLLAERIIAFDAAHPDYFAEVSLIVSEQGRRVAAYEDTDYWFANKRFTHYSNDDFFASPASGSADYDTMIVIPCSMGFVGRVASGVSDSLMARAADVMLKERRRLILVPRETPLSLIHLENMTRLSRAGAIICPASPSFYSKPDDIIGLCNTLIDKVMSLSGVDDNRFCWSASR